VDIGVNVRELGKVNYEKLKDAVLAVRDLAWQEDDVRQKNYSQHKDTESIVLLWRIGWDPHKVVKKNGCFYVGDEASKLIDEIVERHYPDGGEFLKAAIVKLKPGGIIKLHKDAHPSFAIGHRIHVPLKTSKDVIFKIRDERVVMEEGRGYEINNLKRHEVYNGGTEDRIHLIFDYVPPQ
jgi:aspartyl/asparaginyl beta-hydroxylase (cupin superfamily)